MWCAWNRIWIWATTHLEDQRRWSENKSSLFPSEVLGVLGGTLIYLPLGMACRVPIHNTFITKVIFVVTQQEQIESVLVVCRWKKHHRPRCIQWLFLSRPDGMLEVNVLKREKCQVVESNEDFEDAITKRNYHTLICKDVDFSATKPSSWHRDDLKGIVFMGMAECFGNLLTVRLYIPYTPNWNWIACKRCTRYSFNEPDTTNNSKYGSNTPMFPFESLDRRCTTKKVIACL